MINYTGVYHLGQELDMALVAFRDSPKHCMVLPVWTSNTRNIPSTTLPIIVGTPFLGVSAHAEVLLYSSRLDIEFVKCPGFPGHCKVIPV